jgi:hypothetical protein
MTWGLAKKNDISQVGALIEGFGYEYLIKRMLIMRLITKKNSRYPPKKVV